MRKGIFALVLSALVLLSGCSFELMDSGSLLRPPKTTGTEQEILEAIDEALGRRPLLRYPRSGDYRSAIVLKDIDNDDIDEAIVFYSESAESVITSFAVVDRDKGDWKLVAKTDGPGGSVDTLLFGDIIGNNSIEIIIGWSAGLGAAGKKLAVYAVEGGELRSMAIEGEVDEDSLTASGYSAVEVFDIDSDGVCEIVTAKLNSRTETSYARMLKCLSDGNERKLYVAGSCKLDSAVTKYERFVPAMIDDNHNALVIDSLKDAGVTVSEIVYWDSSKANLSAPFNSAETGEVSNTDRPTDINALDIDSDGVVEFPRCRLLPCFDANSETPFYMTSWYDFDIAAGKLSEKCEVKSIVNGEDGYSVIIPSQWKNITVRYDSTSKILSFCKVKREVQTVTVATDKVTDESAVISRDEEAGTSTVETTVEVYGQELFRIRVFAASEEETMLSSGFEKLGEKDGTVIGAYMVSDETEDISYNIIKVCFTLI